MFVAGQLATRFDGSKVRIDYINADTIYWSYRSKYGEQAPRARGMTALTEREHFFKE